MDEAGWLEAEPLEDKQNRVDLRKLPFVTIDGEVMPGILTRCIARSAPGRWRLWVAIADVITCARLRAGRGRPS